jgi:hypothetical protein
VKTGIRRGLRHVADVIDSGYARLTLPRRFGARVRVDVIGIYREPHPIAEVVAELTRSRHEVRVRLGAMGDAHPRLARCTAAAHMSAGKFQNLNELLLMEGDGADFILVVDDDVTVPRGFLDRMIEVCQRLDLALAQPAQTRFSNANWSIARRRFLSVARLTQFVEIGPVTLLRADAAELLTPFPAQLRYGWGLDFHWSHVMAAHGLRMGIVDALAVTHATRKVASTYSWDAAQAEGRAYLETVDHAPPSVAREGTLRTHRMVGRGMS